MTSVRLFTDLKMIAAKQAIKDKRWEWTGNEARIILECEYQICNTVSLCLPCGNSIGNMGSGDQPKSCPVGLHCHWCCSLRRGRAVPRFKSMRFVSCSIKLRLQRHVLHPYKELLPTANQQQMVTLVGQSFTPKVALTSSWSYNPQDSEHWGLSSSYTF